MFLLIGEDSWKDNLLKSLTLFFRNWKCGISSGFGDISLHKVENIDWLAKLTCNAELAIQEIWSSFSFIFSWPSTMELRTSSILSWLIRIEPSLGLMGLDLWSKRLKYRWTLALGYLSPNVGVWSVSPPCNVGNFCQVIRIDILRFEVSPPIYGCWVAWLGFEVSCRSDMGLWCCNSGVSSMLMGFSTMIGVMGLELELLA